jgi:hypothetical protein
MSRRSLSLIALLAAACGEVKSPSDGDAMTRPDADPAAPDADPSAPDADPGAPDATPPPDALPPCTWRAGIIVPNANSATYEGGATVSASGKTLLYNRLIALESDSDIFIAKRDSLGSPFRTGIRLPNVNTVNVFDDAPELSDSGLEVFFTRTVPETANYQLWTARRETEDGDFGAPGQVGVNGFSSSLSGDGLSLYYVDPTTRFVRRIKRERIGGPWGEPRDVMATIYRGIDISANELSILLSDGPVRFDQPPLAVATRNTPDEPFGPAKPIEGVVLPGDQALTKQAAWRSGEREMFLEMHVAGGVGNTDIYSAVCD